MDPQQPVEASVDTVIQTAIQLEEMGRDFYLSLVAATVDPAVAAVCRRLAAEETQHEATFRRMRSDLASQGKTFLTPDATLAQARQTARQAILPDSATVARLARTARLADLLDVAIQTERNAIQFYSALARCLPPGTAVDSVIHQEKNHLRALEAARRPLTTKL